MCFWEEAQGSLFTGDLVYKDTLFAYFPSTDPQLYLASLERVSALPVKSVSRRITRWILGLKS
jgi:glyoxylase-like metal-dependent hydrolase (beta-lactamase superfamily II)